MLIKEKYPVYLDTYLSVYVLTFVLLYIIVHKELVVRLISVCSEEAGAGHGDTASNVTVAPAETGDTAAVHCSLHTTPCSVSSCREWQIVK